MSALHIRQVDDAVVEALKRRAARNNRSLEGELREILRAASDEEGRRRAGRRKLKLRTVAVGGPQTFGRDEIYGDQER